MQPPMENLSWIGDLINSGGGWAAFLAFLFFGGRLFMALARDFCNKVVMSLEKINDAIVSQERRVDLMTHQISQVAQQVGKHGESIERLMRHIATKVTE